MINTGLRVILEGVTFCNFEAKKYAKYMGNNNLGGCYISENSFWHFLTEHQN